MKPGLGQYLFQPVCYRKKSKWFTFDCIAPPFKDNLSSAKAPPAPVIMHRGQLQVAKLAEQLVDVALAHPKVQIAHQQLSRAGGGDACHSATAAVAVPTVPIHVVVPLPIWVAALEALVPTCGARSVIAAEGVQWVRTTPCAPLVQGEAKVR